MRVNAVGPDGHCILLIKQLIFKAVIMYRNLYKISIKCIYCISFVCCITVVITVAAGISLTCPSKLSGLGVERIALNSSFNHHLKLSHENRNNVIVSSTIGKNNFFTRSQFVFYAVMEYHEELSPFLPSYMLRTKY